MPKNAVQRLQKIDNDLKTVISIYEVSNKCKNTHNESEIEEGKNATQLPQIKETFSSERLQESETLQFDFSNRINSIVSQTPEDVNLIESVQSLKNKKKPRSELLPFSTQSTICEVSHVKIKQAEGNRYSEKQDPVCDTLDNSKTKIRKTPSHEKSPLHPKKSKESRNKSRFLSSRESSIVKKYPDWLIHTTSNWFGSVKYSNSLNKDRPSNIPPISKTVSRLPDSKEKNTKNRKMRLKEKDFSVMDSEKDLANSADLCSQGDDFTNLKTLQETRKTVDFENGDDELSKMIEKSNVKLKKMRISKELALDIAKHLKEKYEEIQQSKQEVLQEMLKVQKDNEKLKNELKETELKINELINFRAKQTEEDSRRKEKLEKNLRTLKTRICELKKEHREELLEIEKIQLVRIAEIRNELENKENQAKKIQRLSNENCQLLASNNELSVMLNDRYLEKQYLEQKIRQLEDEVQMEKQHLKIKAKELEETNKELQLIRQTATDLENQVKMLKENTENLDETRKNLIKQTEEYKQQIKLNQQEMNQLQNENLTLKTELENGKDALLIKTKIIEDQQETIKKLKEKSEEAKTLMREKESLQRVLNTEREEKLELEEAVERLKWRKEELKKKIKALENDFFAPQKVAQDLQKTQTVLFDLENQVYNKQKEWELQLSSLIREKEQACSIAEYATKKLIQTNSEFQKQSKEHEKLRRILVENFAQKENIYWGEQQEP